MQKGSRKLGTGRGNSLRFISEVGRECRQAMIPQVCRQYVHSAQNARRVEFLAANPQALHTHTHTPTHTHWPDFPVRKRE